MIVMRGTNDGYDNIAMSCNEVINDKIYHVSCQIVTRLGKLYHIKSWSGLTWSTNNC